MHPDNETVVNEELWRAWLLRGKQQKKVSARRMRIAILTALVFAAAWILFSVVFPVSA